LNGSRVAVILRNVLNQFAFQAEFP